MWFFTRVALVVGCGFAVACSDATVVEPSGGHGGGGGDGGGSVGGGGNGGMGGGVDPREQDNLALAECADDAGCPGGWAQQIEGGMPFSMIDMACVVTAMRDRTPGRYAVQHNHTWGNGETDEDYTLVITPSGEVEVGMLESTSIQTPDLQMSQSYEATRRCVLLDASFFQACLDAIQMGDGSGSVPQAAWDCVYPSLGSGLPWFDSCVEQAPTCQ